MPARSAASSDETWTSSTASSSRRDACGATRSSGASASSAYASRSMSISSCLRGQDMRRKHGFEKGPDGAGSSGRCGCMVTDMRAELDARIGHRERLPRRSVDNVAGFVFDHPAVARGLCLIQEDGSLVPRVVKGVVGAGVFDKLHVLARPAQPLDVVLCRLDRNVVIGGAVKQSNGLCDDVCVIDILRVTGCVERYVAGEIVRSRFPHRSKAIERGVKSYLSSARESHEDDTFGIDPRPPGDGLERSIGVDDSVQAAELGLVFDRSRDAAAGEDIERERGDPD